MARMLSVAPSPHVHGKLHTQGLMLDVLIALTPAWLVGLWVFGSGALVVTLVSVLSCVLFEYLLVRYVLHQTPTLHDLSAVVTGLLLAMNLPSGIPWWIVVLGALMAIGVCKVSFGGLGNNLFNPALFARAFLLISFPVQMTTWVQPGACNDACTGATPLADMKAVIQSGEAMPDMSYLDLFLGNVGGSFGEVSALALLLGGIYLLVRRVISWHIPVSVLGSVLVFSTICWWAAPNTYPTPIFALLSGGIMLGAIFMATDYVTSPMTHKGMIIFGVGIGCLTMVIRYWGAYPEGTSFAILIMNALVPLINKYVKPSRFGAVSKKGVK